MLSAIAGHSNKVFGNIVFYFFKAYMYASSEKVFNYWSISRNFHHLKRLHKVIQLKLKYLLNAKIILNNSKQLLFKFYFLHKVSCSLSLTIKPLMAKSIHNFAEDYIYLKYYIIYYTWSLYYFCLCEIIAYFLAC